MSKNRGETTLSFDEKMLLLRGLKHLKKTNEKAYTQSLAFYPNRDGLLKGIENCENLSKKIAGKTVVLRGEEQ